MSDPLVFTAELTLVTNLTSGATTTFYFANVGFTSKSTDTPASTFFDERLTQPVDVSRWMFKRGTTQGENEASYGSMILANGDGLLDALADYGFDGQRIVVRQGVAGAAYPSAFTTVFQGTMLSLNATSKTIVVTVLGREAELTVPVQPTKYAGSNVLPLGLEGVATDLKGKPKPLCYGVVNNIAPPCVNTAKLIYQVNDGAIVLVDNVYDSGIPLVGLGTWTSQTSGFGASSILGMAYGAGLWVAVGQAGKLFSSPDFSSWTSRTSGFGADTIEDVDYGNGLFVAVGTSGKLSTSPDGITWTSRTSGFGTKTMRAVRYCPLAPIPWIAVGENDGASGNPPISTSPDGITWTLRTVAITDVVSNFVGVAFGNGLYFTGGRNGWGATSPDGVTWTAVATFGGSSNDVSFVVFANRNFVVSRGSSLGIMTSADALSWSLQINPFPSGSTVTRAIYGAGQFVAMGGDGLKAAFVMTSTDGVVWTTRNAGTSTSIWQSGAFDGDSQFLIAGASGVLASATAFGADYTSSADLLDDTLAPKAGSVRVYPAGGYIRLGSPPAGQITCDVTEGTTAADRTTAQVWKRVMVKAGKSSGTDFSATDITTLDTANSAVIGLWTGLDEMTYRDVLDEVADTLGCWWGPDRTGLYRIQQLLVPGATPAATFVANDLIGPIERVPMDDQAQGIPVFKVVLGYAKNYTVQTSGLAGGIDDDRRALLALEYATVTYTDGTVQTGHLMATQLEANTLLTSAADALAEATRRQVLRGSRRDCYPITVAMDATTSALDIGSVVMLAHTRYGLSPVGLDPFNPVGQTFRVIGVEPNSAMRQVTLSLWGSQLGSVNLVTDDGTYAVASDGSYGIGGPA